MDDQPIDSKDCMLCRKRPVDFVVLLDMQIQCSCGNIIYVKEIPALYTGIRGNAHSVIIAFPGCIVCGKPINIPWVLGLRCKSDHPEHAKLQEIYHNTGLRN